MRTVTMPIGAELVEQLEHYVHRHEMVKGYRPRCLTVGRPEWEAMGRPDIVAGVRIEPSPEPLTGYPPARPQRRRLSYSS